MFKVSVQSSGSSAGGRHEPEGMVPSLLEPPVHNQASLFLTNQSLPLAAQIHTQRQNPAPPCRVRKNKRWNLVKEMINERKETRLLISGRRYQLDVSKGSTGLSYGLSSVTGEASGCRQYKE